MGTSKLEQVWAEKGFVVACTGGNSWAAIRQVDGVEFWLTDDNESREPDPYAKLLVGAYMPNSGKWLEFSTEVESLAQALPHLVTWAANLDKKDKRLMSEPTETITQIDECKDAALDWLIAKVEQVEVFVSTSASGVKTCWRQDKPKQQYSPTSRWRHCGKLLDSYDVGFSRCGELIQAVCPTASGDQVSAFGPDRMTASCRAIAKAFFGNFAVVPLVLSIAPKEVAQTDKSF